MSLKALKESLQTCKPGPSWAPIAPLATATELKSAHRRPPKTTLKEQLASIQHLVEPSLPKISFRPSPARQKSCPTASANNADSKIDLESRSTSTGDLNLIHDPSEHGQILQRFTLRRCNDGVAKSQPRESSSESGLGKDPTDDSIGASRKKLKFFSQVSGPGDGGLERGSKFRGSQNGKGNGSIEQAECKKSEENEEEEGVRRDSEAGLFIQSEREGPYEPLVLWPPPGESSSGGVEADRVVQVPASINSRLLEHQREGVKFLYNLHKENRGGILGDDMGLGKTIQSIAFLAALLGMDGETHTVRPSRASTIANGPPENRVGKPIPHLKVFLILCPTSVLRNWQQEFEAWGAFRVGIYHGVQRDAVMAKVEAGDLEVVLTSHDMFRLNVSTLCAVTWDCVIVDEAHRLKNEKSQLYQACVKMRTKRRYGLTGTIMQNKYTELFNVFDWAAPGSLGPREHFREYYGEPLKQGQRISAPERFVRIAEERKQHLVKVLSRHLLRRTKQETIGHLMLGKEDNVVFCKMSEVQRRVYRRLLQSPDFQLLISKDLLCSCGSHLSRVECCHRTAPDGVMWSYLHIDNPDGCDNCPFCLVLPCLTKLQQVSNHLELIKPSPKDDLEKQRKDEVFAAAALGEDAALVGGVWQDESFLGLSDAQHCGKMRALDNLLTSWLARGDKVLLFSYSVKMLDILDRLMIRRGFSFCRLDGSTPMGMRQTLVDDFNTSPSKQVFLISTRAGGLGLNLVSANRVVIFDPNWNPAQDLQAQDRSFRFGQRRHVTVFRLLAAGSLEELVYSRQIYKQQLFNIGVNGTFEKRYFEGVQDSKDFKGELFGISNLFRDLSDEVFTSGIIEKHEERLVTSQRSGTVFNAPKSCSPVKSSGEQIRRLADDEGDGNIGAWDDSHLVEADHPDQETLTLGDSCDARGGDCMAVDQKSDTLSDFEGEEANLNDSEKQHEKLLKDAGVVYTHRNEEVVNLGAPSQKHRNVKCSERSKPKNSKELPKTRAGKSTVNGENSSVYRISSSPKVTSARESWPPLEASPAYLSDLDTGHGEEAQASLTLEKNTHLEELAKFEEMDETAKWLLSASGFYPTQLMNDHSISQSSLPSVPIQSDMRL